MGWHSTDGHIIRRINSIHNNWSKSCREQHHCSEIKRWRQIWRLDVSHLLWSSSGSHCHNGILVTQYCAWMHMPQFTVTVVRWPLCATIPGQTDHWGAKNINTKLNQPCLQGDRLKYSMFDEKSVYIFLTTLIFWRNHMHVFYEVQVLFFSKMFKTKLHVY